MLALYWLARLIEGGADPVFIARRLCILASEDIGLADPQAMVQAAAAADITRLIGLPEALYPLSQATIYLAHAPKSNAVKRAYMAAVEDATETAREPVPLHLRNAITPLMKRVGYGSGYRYVHSDRQAKEEMACLPESLRGRVYYDEEAQETDAATFNESDQHVHKRVKQRVSTNKSEKELAFLQDLYVATDWGETIRRAD